MAAAPPATGVTCDASSEIECFYGRRGRPRKITDYETRFRCGGGIGVLREEVWVDDNDEISRYNLALILSHLFAADKGRVLGFDNAHGVHERHFMGQVEACDFTDYATIAARFFREAVEIRRRYEDQGF